MKFNKPLASLNSLPKKWKMMIDSVSDERGNGDGIWIYLKKGFINSEAGTHCFHYDKITTCISELKFYTKPCECDECKS